MLGGRMRTGCFTAQGWSTRSISVRFIVMQGLWGVLELDTWSLGPVEGILSRPMNQPVAMFSELLTPSPVDKSHSCFYKAISLNPEGLQQQKSGRAPMCVRARTRHAQ